MKRGDVFGYLAIALAVIGVAVMIYLFLSGNLAAT